LPHVPMSHHDISELPSIISAIRGDATREGAVLYLQTADQHVVGLVKVKVLALYLCGTSSISRLLYEL
jgi:hypothetical protein